MVLKLKKLDEEAFIPSYATDGSAGLDLKTTEDATIMPGETHLTSTGLAMSVDKEYWGGIYPRSGLAVKSGINLANCVAVIDSDYRGELRVPLHNNSTAPFEIHKGDRIAQLLILPVMHPEIQVCDDLGNTERGAGGFGSTGK